MGTLQVILHNAAVRGALVALGAAVWTDWHSWKSWGDIAFNFRTASFRWVTSAIGGAIGGAGLGAIS